MYLHNGDKISLFLACSELYSTYFANTASAPVCHVVRSRLLPIGRPATRLSPFAHDYRFPIGSPLLYTGLLLATHFCKDLPFSLPHSAESVRSVTHSVDSTLLLQLSTSWTYVSSCYFSYNISPASTCPHSGTFQAYVTSCRPGRATPATWPWQNLHRVIAAHTSCRSARVAHRLRFSSSYIQCYCFTNLYSGTIHGPHTFL